MPPTDVGASSLVVDRAYWMILAKNAWSYFRPGVGLDPTTGLLRASSSYAYSTDWDVGIYIQAILDTSQLGILAADGTWGANARLAKILGFLETRPLTSDGVPYSLYQSANGDPNGTAVQVPYDAGELLVALNNLKDARPDLASEVNNIVYNRTNYGPLEKQVENFTSSRYIYDYYAALGFSTFWPNQFSALAGSILENILSAPTVSSYGVNLPVSILTCEPVLLSVFNFPPSAVLENLTDIVYSAQEARYNATGEFTAFSEGNTGLENVPYVYEYIVFPDGSTWIVDDPNFNNVQITPMIFFKTAVGLLAIRDSPFTEKMTSYVESKLPTPINGYSEGIDEKGRVETWLVGNTNGMIIQASRYALLNNSFSLQSPNPTTETPQEVSPFAGPWIVPALIAVTISAIVLGLLIAIRKRLKRVNQAK